MYQCVQRVSFARTTLQNPFFMLVCIFSGCRSQFSRLDFIRYRGTSRKNVQRDWNYTSANSLLLPSPHPPGIQILRIPLRILLRFTLRPLNFAYFCAFSPKICPFLRILPQNLPIFAYALLRGRRGKVPKCGWNELKARRQQKKHPVNSFEKVSSNIFRLLWGCSQTLACYNQAEIL